ncbi:hypothetical protein [Amycolatopsis sp. CA-126428]|uniref:hypothetical protein n=1 Tax=Amycolatopsis sp. CA-126428 TaxID=2073158 RepID=UPI000CD22968|nr:hypothetical protein [Amycolatopsis sp. CA-126428]
MRRGGREGQAAGFRTLSTTTTELHTWTTGIFADNFYAILHLSARDPGPAREPKKHITADAMSGTTGHTEHSATP